jgi:hypothetical protein
MHHFLFIIEAGIEVRRLSAPVHLEGRNQVKLVKLCADQLRCLLVIIFINMYISTKVNSTRMFSDILDACYCISFVGF